MKESGIHRQILDYLDTKRVCHCRNNSVLSMTRQAISIVSALSGSPDIICVINGQYVGIEVKALKGRQSEHKKEFQRNLEAVGGKYMLAYHWKKLFQVCSFSRT
jgi:hypothetical protein